MAKKARTDYAFVAQRIDPKHSQNLGDFAITRKMPKMTTSERREFQHYHYSSVSGRVINRGSLAMPVITRGSELYVSCIKAVERLLEEEQQDASQTGEFEKV